MWTLWQVRQVIEECLEAAALLQQLDLVAVDIERCSGIGLGEIDRLFQRAAGEVGKGELEAVCRVQRDTTAQRSIWRSREKMGWVQDGGIGGGF